MNAERTWNFWYTMPRMGVCTQPQLRLLSLWFDNQLDIGKVTVGEAV